MTYVKYHERCGAPHAGSSTCLGCDIAFWLDDDPYKNIKNTGEAMIEKEAYDELAKMYAALLLAYTKNTDEALTKLRKQKDELLLLEALRQCGADNWYGRSDAIDLRNEWRKK